MRDGQCVGRLLAQMLLFLDLRQLVDFVGCHVDLNGVAGAAKFPIGNLDEVAAETEKAAHPPARQSGLILATLMPSWDSDASASRDHRAFWNSEIRRLPSAVGPVLAPRCRWHRPPRSRPWARCAAPGAGFTKLRRID